MLGDEHAGLTSTLCLHNVSHESSGGDRQRWLCACSFLTAAAAGFFLATSCKPRPCEKGGEGGQSHILKCRRVLSLP